MGGSSGSKPKTDTKTNEPTGTIPGTSPLMTQPAFIGDNQNLLAQQLAAGGYGQVPDLIAMLSQTFTPMQVLDTRPGAAPAPTTPTTPTTPTGPNRPRTGSGYSIGRDKRQVGPSGH
jgi:hypothetical protein